MKRGVSVRMRDGLVALVVLTTAWQAHALDCAKADVPVERLICASPALQAQDLRLNDVFKVAAVIAADPTALRDEQRRWVGTRNSCADEGCVAAAYAERITALERLAPVKDVWVRTMPGQFRDGWLFFAQGGKEGPFSAAEPVWVINTAQLHSESPVEANPRWWDEPWAPRNQTAYPGGRGTAVQVFGFFSGSLVSGQVASVNPRQIVVTNGGRTYALSRTPKNLTSRTEESLPVSGANEKDLLSQYLHSDCSPFSHVVGIQLPDRASIQPAWYGVRNEQGALYRRGVCDFNELHFSYDSFLGRESGLGWGSGAAHVLSDGSFLLVSSWWDSVHVVRIRGDGSVPPQAAQRIKVVPWDRLARLREQAVKYCESDSEQSLGINIPGCIVEEIEKNL